MKFEAVIFDMDGLLIDSQDYWVEADRDFFRKRDIDPTDELIIYWKRKLMGQSIEEGSAKLIKELNLPETLEEVVKERRGATDKIYTEWTKPTLGANDLIKKLKSIGQKQAIASGSYMYRIKKVVERFGWEGMFDQLVSSSIDNFKSKPAPDIYLYTAQVLGVDPVNCVVLEDAENGISSAKAAGMMCITVPEHGIDPSQADIIVDSLEDNKVYEFLGIN